LQKHISNQPYSPKVAVQLQQDVDQFRDQSAIENDVGEMEVHLGRARSAVDGKRLTAVDLGDMEMLGEATAEGAEMGFYTAEEAGVLFWEGQQRIFSKRRDGVVADNPQEVLKYAENPEGKEMPAEFAGLGQATWRELKGKARESMYRHQRGLMEDFREAVGSNMVRDDADAEVWAEMHVPEGMRDATLRPLMHRVLHGEGVDMAEVNRIRAAIGAHDPKGPDAKGREERMRLLHMQFPAEVQEELDGMLEARVKSGRPESPAAQAVRKLILDAHDRAELSGEDGRALSYRESPAILDALRQWNHVRAFGLGPEDWKSLYGVTGPERVQKFREAVQARVRRGLPEIARPDLHAKMDAKTQALFQAVVRGEEYIDPETREQSLLRASNLIRTMEDHVAGNALISSEALKEWLAEEMAVDQRNRAIDEINKELDAAP
jgi:hypothetical protein